MKLFSSVHQGNLRTIRSFVRTNVAPAHHYGRTIVGVDPKATDIEKSTIVLATGYMAKCASSMLSIQLAFGIEAHGFEQCMG